MRKGLLIVALAVACFAGGAAMNGNGLAWARSLIQFDPRVLAAGPTADKDEPKGPKGEPSKADNPIPSVPPPPLVLATKRRSDHRPADEPASPAPSDPAKDVAEGSEADALPLLRPTEAPQEPASGEPAPADKQDEPSPPKAASPSPTPAAPEAKTSEPAPFPLEPAAGEDSGPKTKGEGDGNRAQAPATLDPEVERAARSDAPPRDWAKLRRKMREMGVGRYWIEGEPGGPVHFRCVIPLAGGRAVGQHFEAEGDDDFQAAEAALKRVALWRATEKE